jgi:hypothetical protein
MLIELFLIPLESIIHIIVGNILVLIVNVLVHKWTSDMFPGSLIDSNINLKWKQQKNKESKHAP